MIAPTGIPSGESFGTASITHRTLSQQDLDDIADVFWNYVFALTVARFMGLK